jgi:hypothetical protein
MEIDEDYYENLIIKKSHNYDDIIKALDLVKKYIIKENKIITGGMAIDYALKLKGENGIYGDDVLPDYDFFSEKHYYDAYKIAELLKKNNFENISVINAMHPSTMRVRIDFIVVADITFIHNKILSKFPTLKYKNIHFIHPHVQMIDQHRSLSFPYENVPWETIKSARPRKDMKRYDLLYNLYPLRLLAVKKQKEEFKIIEFKKSILENQCITGFFALNYWIKKAKKLGYKTSINFGDIKFKKDIIEFKFPADSYGLTIYSDNIKDLYLKIKNEQKIKNEEFYEQFLDKLPKKIILDNEWELLKNDEKVAAHKEIDNIYIANIQNIMMYLLIQYILLRKINNVKTGYSFYIGYLECRNLIKWASNRYYNIDKKNIKKENEQFKKFLPTAEYYGSKNLNKSYITSKHRFDIKNKTIDKKEKDLYKQPNNVYERDFKNGFLSPYFYNFNASKSKVFNFSGVKIDNFLDL